MKARIIFIVLAAMFITGGAMAANLERSKKFFDQLDKDHLSLIEQFYDKDIVFQDPVHQLHGVSAVTKYYESLYKNVTTIRFEYSQGVEAGDTIALPWRMFLKTPAINSGKEITVDGVSMITFGGTEGKAIYHRDYFDMGEFVYERVSILGSIIRHIKGRMAGE